MADTGGVGVQTGKMPFRSVKQRKFMFARHPKIAKRWVRKYGWKVGGGGKRKINPGFRAHGDERGGYGKDWSPDY